MSKHGVFCYLFHSDKAAQIVSKRVDDFRERNIPQVGVVHDPIKETLKVDSDHTYGITLPTFYVEETDSEEY